MGHSPPLSFDQNAFSALARDRGRHHCGRLPILQLRRIHLRIHRQYMHRSHNHLPPFLSYDRSSVSNLIE